MENQTVAANGVTNKNEEYQKWRPTNYDVRQRLFCFWAATSQSFIENKKKSFKNVIYDNKLNN